MGKRTFQEKPRSEMSSSNRSQFDRAKKPTDIGRRGWIAIIKRVIGKIAPDHLFLVSAGLAFYALLSIFPLLIATVSIYGLVADPVTVTTQINQLAGILPGDIRDILGDQLNSIVTVSAANLTLGAVISIGAALWTVSTGVIYLIDGLNIVYGEDETRGFFKLRGIALLLTVGLILFALFSLVLIAVLPAVLAFVGLGGMADTLIRLARWPLLGLAVITGLAVLNRYGPDRRAAKWRWVTVGSLVATISWLALSIGFSYYVTNFGNYNEVYGSLGAIIVLMMWFYFSAFVVLIGAEFNAETEHQTYSDTTVGEEKPFGQREAHMADTLPKSS